jgi:hypothetical protein
MPSSNLNVTVEKVKLTAMPLTGPADTAVAPVKFTFNLSFSELVKSKSGKPGKARPLSSSSNDVVAQGKVPGGPGLSLDEDIYVDRVFKLNTKPKIILANVIISKTKGANALVTIELIITSAKVKSHYSNGEKKSHRMFEMKNPPVDISGSDGATFEVQPCAGKGDMDTRVLTTFPVTIQGL